MVSLVNNLAYTENSYPPSLGTMLCKATDCGFQEYAYNAANQLMDTAKSVKGYKEAERYFKIAMAFDEKPRVQAAAHVNYCPIVRDGMISGKPDWPAAIAIYEKAAKMGLVKAMFNAGNVCNWLSDKGDRVYGARAAYWFRYALDFRTAQKPNLDMESPSELEEVFEQCMLSLSALNIDAKFDGADLEEGIQWARALANKGNLHARHNLGVGYMQRLAAMTTRPQSSPGANWRSVLSKMDWHFTEDVRTHTLPALTAQGKRGHTQVDGLSVALSNGKVMPLFVTHEPCLPGLGGIELICGIAEALVSQNPDGFFLVSRKGMFMEQDGRSYTPIYVWQDETFSQQALWMGSSPDVVLQHAKEGVDFLDERFSTWTCMIPIAVNALDEGFVVAKDTTFGQSWVGVGGPWRMPFVDKTQLSKLGLVIADGHR
jgi:hypothetical protein